MTTSIQTINDKGIDLDDWIAACRRPNWRRAVIYCLEGHAASPAITSRSTRYASMPQRAASSAGKWFVKLRTPAEQPATAADGPRAESDAGDVQSAVAERKSEVSW
jgi:hypothetical protein